MLIQILPEGDGITCQLQDIFYSARFQVPFVVVFCVVVKTGRPDGRGLGPGFAKGGIKGPSIHLEKGAVVMEVITHKPIRHGSLRADGFEGRVTACRCHRSIEAGIGSTKYRQPCRCYAAGV